MKEVVVTQYWMLGVTAVMVVYGLIALAGYIKKRNAGSEKTHRPKD